MPPSDQHFKLLGRVFSKIFPLLKAFELCRITFADKTILRKELTTNKLCFHLFLKIDSFQENHRAYFDRPLQSKIGVMTENRRDIIKLFWITY
jgi:hypothetical protein